MPMPKQSSRSRWRIEAFDLGARVACAMFADTIVSPPRFRTAFTRSTRNGSLVLGEALGGSRSTPNRWAASRS